MKTGVVKFYNSLKGFGFIKVDGSNEDLFVHESGLIDKVKDGDLVTFEMGVGKKGPVAINVKRK